MKEGILKWEITGNLLMSFATAGPVPEPVWADFVKHLKKPEVKRYIGTAIGAAELNSVQRKNASDTLKACKISAVVITESGLVRGLVTAASWLGADIKSFDWPELYKGLEHLGVTGSQQERAVAIIQRLKATHTR